MLIFLSKQFPDFSVHWFSGKEKLPSKETIHWNFCGRTLARNRSFQLKLPADFSDNPPPPFFAPSPCASGRFSAPQPSEGETCAIAGGRLKGNQLETIHVRVLGWEAPTHALPNTNAFQQTQPYKKTCCYPHQILRSSRRHQRAEVPTSKKPHVFGTQTQPCCAQCAQQAEKCCVANLVTCHHSSPCAPGSHSDGTR